MNFEPEICNHNLAAVADAIVAITQSCADLDEGAYWGDVLAPY